MYIYIDESGDLGFKKKGASKYFMITLLITKDPKKVKRVIKKCRQRILKKKHKKFPELKASKSSPLIRKYILKELAKLDLSVLTIILNKSQVYDYLKTKREKLYNYIAGLILAEAQLEPSYENVVIDKRVKKKAVRRDFDTYIQDKIDKKRLLPIKRLRISHFNSQKREALQAMDFVSWAIFRKYEHKDTIYYDFIKEKISTEKELFK